MKAKKLAVAIGLGIGLATAVAPASAYVKWAFQDDDIDILYRPTNPLTGGGGTLIDPATCAGTDCNIQIGDVLISVFQYPTFTIGGVNAIPAGKEVTGVAAIQYFGNGVDAIGDPARIWTAYAGGFDEILGLGDGADPTVVGGAAGGSAMIATYINDGSNVANPSSAGEDRNLDLDIANNTATNCTSVADCIDEGSKGQLIQVDGGIFADGTKLDPDNFWISGTQGTNITGVYGLDSNTIVLAVNFGLSVLYNLVEPILPQSIQTGLVNPACTTNTLDGCVDLKGTATVNGGVGLLNGAFAHSTSITMTKYVAVPEPGTLVLLGAGLLGLAGIRRRKS